jgi:hypothetical protein
MQLQPADTLDEDTEPWADSEAYEAYEAYEGVAELRPDHAVTIQDAAAFERQLAARVAEVCAVDPAVATELLQCCDWSAPRVYAQWTEDAARNDLLARARIAIEVSWARDARSFWTVICLHA